MERVLFSRELETSVGDLLLMGGAAGLRAVVFIGTRARSELRHEWSLASGEVVLDEGHPLLSRAARELHHYLAGRREAFSVALDVLGTPFQRHVWDVLGRIPRGTTTTYAALAERVGRPRAVRAVANACARNPLPIVVPCHRVLGSDGALTGYLGGLAAKRALLALEGVVVAPRAALRLLPGLEGAAMPNKPTAAAPQLSEAQRRGLTAPNRHGLAADVWLAERADALDPDLWPLAAEVIFDHADAVHRPLGEALLEAWTADVCDIWPHPVALSCFLRVAARWRPALFELVGRRLVTAAGAPRELRRVLREALEALMGGQVASLPVAREVAVDLWLALDPVRHLELLATAARAADACGAHDATDPALVSIGPGSGGDR